MPDLHSLEDLPEAVVSPKRGRSIQLVWIIPLVAAILGIWIAVRAVMQTGPTVTITFQTAEGLEAGKTKIRYKNVDIGEVETIAISKDRSKIVLTAQFTKEVEGFLVEDTRFWVVRPRISGGQVSGVGTLLSGAYIAVDVGESDQPSRHYEGLEVAPILTDKIPGRPFMLEAQDMGSLDIGSPIYFRHIHVGEVTAHDLDPNGRDVHIQIFIRAPYDQYVNVSTRFWHASGFDVTLDSNGMRMETQSLTSILAGGVAFETPANFLNSERAAPGFKFPLHKDHMVALKTVNSDPEVFVMQFSDSVRGLKLGAPVEFRGIEIGEVQSVDLIYNKKYKSFEFPVHVAIFREKLDVADKHGVLPKEDPQQRNELLETLISRGLRAQLRTGNLLTGQLYITLDFFPEAPKVNTNWAKLPIQLPTVPGAVEELQQSIGKIVRKVDKIPFEDIGNHTRNTLASLNKIPFEAIGITTRDSLANLNAATQSLNKLIKRLNEEVAPESTAALTDIRKTLVDVQKSLAPDSPLQQDLRRTLRETSRSAQSIRSLADTLDREPESLLRGKTEDLP